LLAVVLFATGAADQSYAGQLAEDQARSNSHNAAEDAPTGDPSQAEPADRAESETSAAAELQAQSVVWLASHEPTTGHPEYFAELLLRELVRQSLLIAARDGLGLATRDAVLREDRPREGAEHADRVLQFSTHATDKAELQVKLWRGTEGNRQEIWSKTIPLTTDPYEFYFPVVRAMEEASRTELVEALKKAGNDGTPSPAGKAQPRPETLQSLAECTPTSQMLAVREAHAEIRLTGESPELIGVLARGYAHLGYMSQHYWNAMCRVFQARSLLYAERLVAARPDTAFPLWVRGYARALVGLHGAALADLAQAKTLAEKTGEAAPDWVGIAESHSRYDFAALRNLAEGENPWAQLASMLAFMDLARGGGHANVVEAGEETLDTLPEAYLLYDRLCDFGGVAYGHTSTVRGSAALAKYLPPRLAALRGLPEDVKRQLPTAATANRNIFPFFQPSGAELGFTDVPSRVARTLIENKASSEDRGEPSWAVLGRMIQEEDFTFTVRRAQFLKHNLGVPVDDFIAAVLPNLNAHPYAAWLESLAIEKENDAAKYRSTLSRVQVGDLYWREYPFLWDAYAIPLANLETGSELLRKMYRRMDLVALDAETVVYWYSQDRDTHLKLAKSLLPVSPHSPAFIAVLAQHVDADKPQLDTWERDHGAHVWVVRALAYRYVANKEFADAERCLRRRIEISADQEGFEQLAEVFKQQGDDERWRATLEECLQFPDYGLTHASIRVRIARHLMEKREFEKARPYAELAAQTWAGWAMSCASECLEALHEWEASEAWTRNNAVRYPSERLVWYLWCRRTGQGDLEAAKQVAQELVDEYSARTPPAKQDWIGIYHLLNGDRKRAYEAFQAEHTQRRTYWSGFHVILLADEFGDTTLRDRVLAFFVKSGVPDPKSSTYGHAKFAFLLDDAYRGGKNELDLEALDKVLEAVTENPRMDIGYFAAKYLALHGRAADSERYLKRCYASTEVSQLNRTLAAAELLDSGHQLEDLKGPND
jgi:hypothetical protein